LPNLTHAKVSAKADGSDATLIQPSDWNADHATSLPDTAVLDQYTRVVLPGTDRLTAAVGSRVRVLEMPANFRGTYALGSFAVLTDAYQLQYKELRLASDARATLGGNGELFLFDLAPVGRLVLAGRGG
jgi:hypothetical protein